MVLLFGNVVDVDGALGEEVRVCLGQVVRVGAVQLAINAIAICVKVRVNSVDGGGAMPALVLGRYICPRPVGPSGEINRVGVGL